MNFLLFCLNVLAIHVASGNYVARRNVKDFGAVGDGVTDDTAAIILAITQGRGDDPNASYPTVYSSSSLTPALIYFPSGTYKITASLPLIYYTQMVGDADNLPTLKLVSSSTVDVRVIDALSETWGGNLVNQNNFFHQVRNFVLDMTECYSCTGIHWQVAQATQLSNLYFKMGSGTKNQGIWMENGSGGFMSDLVFEGGTYAMWVGNQQFTSRNITISGASVAGIYLNWDWSWSFKSLSISDTPVGVDVGSQSGSLTIFDSQFSGISVAAIRTAFVNTTSATVSTNGLVLENVKFSDSTTSNIVMNSDVVALTASSSTSIVSSWVQGRVWSNGKSSITTKDLKSDGVAPSRPSVLIGDSTASSNLIENSFFEKRRPDFDSSQFVRVNAVTDLGIASDGVTDVTAALQKALTQCAASSSVLFLPHGTYLISETIVMPVGTRVLGEAWSVIMVGNSAGKFSDPASPVVAIQVGNEGDSGVAQLVDLLITTQGPLPGAKLVEWNMADPAGAPGSAGMWEVHFRIGGAIGTNINPSNCPKGDGSAAPAASCAGSWGLLHITSKATAYLENVWGWVADHDLDYDDQINVYNARGLLIESQGPVWLYGTAFEHSLLYQYNLYGAKNVLMAMIQTEQPYFQPAPLTPFDTSEGSTVLAPAEHDPTYCTGDSRCNMALALNIDNGSSDILLYGSGLYSFFNLWDQTCLNSGATDGSTTVCQLEMSHISTDSSAVLFNYNTYGSVYMLSSSEVFATASGNLNSFCSSSVVDLTHRSA